MQIETFEIEESVDETTAEADAKAVELIEKLGLEGQLTLIKKVDDKGRRLQYPEMTAQEIAVYTSIFPARTLLKTYSHSAIPVRVLQVAAHAVEFCDRVQVWHKKHRDPDPLLVGLKGPEYSPNKFYRLARWGDALKDFSELIKEAREIIRQQIKGQLEQTIVSAKVKLESLDSLVEEKLSGGSIDLMF